MYPDHEAVLIEILEIHTENILITYQKPEPKTAENYILIRCEGGIRENFLDLVSYTLFIHTKDKVTSRKLIDQLRKRLINEQQYQLKGDIIVYKIVEEHIPFYTFDESINEPMYEWQIRLSMRYKESIKRKNEDLSI